MGNVSYALTAVSIHSLTAAHLFLFPLFLHIFALYLSLTLSPSLSQILFLAGVGFIIGPTKMYYFFFQSHKLKGTAFFAGGIFIVLIGWPIIGMLVEIYGAFLLFR